jgi:cysteine-rich repeat protein
MTSATEMGRIGWPGIRVGLSLLAGLAVLGLAAQARALCDAPQPGDVWSAQFSVVSGSGDWSVARVGAAPQHLEIRGESDGLLTIGCNGSALDPTTGVLAATVMNAADVLVESGDVGGEATLGMQAMQLAGTNRDTVDVAAAFFPYASGWIGGRFDASGALLESNPGPFDPSAPVVTRVGVGDYEISIPGVANSYTDGMLWAIVDGTGENYANTVALDPTDGSAGTGTWKIYSRDNQGGVLQDRGIRFVYVPWTAGTTYGRVGLGGGVLSVLASSNDYTLQRIGTGQVRLDVTDASPEEGMLLVMGGNSFATPDDNIYRYDVDEDDSLRRFVIVNRDQPSTTSGPLAPQDTELVFTYVPFPPHVVDERKLGSAGAGGPYDGSTAAGAAIARIGDLDADGVPDQVVGSAAVGATEGAIRVLFMLPDGGVKASFPITSNTGGLNESFASADRFGEAVTSVGDVDGDGVVDLAVGAPGRSGAAGAVWILFMNADGSVRAHREIGAGTGGFTGSLDAGDLFGSSLAGIGDLDGDRVPDLVVGAAGDLPNFSGTSAQGSIWVVRLNRDGTAKAALNVGAGVGGFTGALGTGDRFGASMASVGDLTGDGVPDLAVGAPEAANDGGGLLRAGSVWLLQMNADGSVAAQTEIPRIATGFDFSAQNDRFGSSITAVGDLNGDGTQDLAVGATTASSDSSGQVFIVYLGSQMEVVAVQRIGEEAGGLRTGGQDLAYDDAFGSAVGALGDLDGDGVTELSVGHVGDAPGGGSAEGATWTLFLAGAPPVCSDGVLDPSEACDDGGVAPGDACSTTCTLEDAVAVEGTAQGGSVSVVVDGTVVTLPTVGGQSAFVVANALAAAISTDPTLAGAGVYGADAFVDATESLVWTNGRYHAASTTDPGLTVVPEPGMGSMWVAGCLTLAALGRRSRR